jgi:hypothetical protein
MGASPTWVKVCREKKKRAIIAPKIKGAFLDVSEKNEYDVSGEEVHIYNVPVYNVLRPNLDQDIDELDWLAELDPKTPEQVTRAYHAEEYFLIKDDAEADKLAKLTSDTTDPAKVQTDASTKNYAPETRKGACDIRDVSFYRNLRVVDPETGQKTIKRFLLQGYFHYTAKRLLSCHRWSYEHQRRNLVPFEQCLDGGSTTGNVKWHQKVHTYAAHAEIKNAWHANNVLYRLDPDAPNAESLAKRKSPFSSGDVVLAADGEFAAVRPGTEHGTLLNFMGYIKADAQEASKVSDFEAGRSIPGRTPSSTVQQILEKGGLSGDLFMLMLGERVSKVMRLYLETVRQYQPLGETIPIVDEETRQIIELPMRYPVGEVLDNFRISLTAADEALAKEHSPEEVAVFLQVYQSHTQFVASIAGPMADQRATPAMTDLFKRIIEGEQVVFNQLVSMVRSDTKEKFDLRPAVAAIEQEKLQMMQQMQQMGAMGGDQAASGGGAIPGAEGAPEGGGPQGVSGEPGMEAGAMAPSGGGVPPEQPLA